MLHSFAKWLGPYRLWRIFHEYRNAYPDKVQEVAEYLLRAEKPEYPVGKAFFAEWIDTGTLIEMVRHHSVRLDSPFYAVLVFRQVLHNTLRFGMLPRRVLEIGPGVHLGAAFCFSAMGCEKVAVADIARIEIDPVFYRDLKALLAVVGGFRWWRYNSVVNPYPAIRDIEFWDVTTESGIIEQIDVRSPEPADQLSFNSTEFDLVYSVNAFEHFPDPFGAVREMFRVLRPGGLTVHEIDLRYHCDMRQHQPHETLKFLEFSSEDWERRSEQYGQGRGLKSCLAGEWGSEVYCNRLRIHECEALFKRAGFEVLETMPLQTLAVTEIRRERFVEPYRSMPTDALKVLLARIVARKPI